MVNLDRYPSDVAREVKTCFDLPTARHLGTAVETGGSFEQRRVVAIKDFEVEKIPNRLKGVNNLFSNYGNVERVAIAAKENGCQIHFQTSIGAEIALK